MKEASYAEGRSITWKNQKSVACGTQGCGTNQSERVALKSRSRTRANTMVRTRNVIQDVSYPHPDHAGALNRLKRLEGQIAGVRRMVEERRYCIDILTQVRAASAALAGFEELVVEKHLRSCVASAARSNSEKMIEEKIQELMTLFSRRKI